TRHAYRTPWCPLQALALPLLQTMARRHPPLMCSRVTRTGAAWTRLVVKVAAAAARTSDTTRARSLRQRFTPMWSPAARKPLGAVTPPGTSWYDGAKGFSTVPAKIGRAHV